MTTDRELLTSFLQGNEDAFRTLTTRYVGLIYSTAKRQAPPHLAEDITQAVFLLLAKKAKTLRNPELLPAWLLKITRYCAANARRADQRRLHHEQKAAAMTPTIAAAPTDPDDPDSLAPHLDTALLSLPSIDRTAILLRYYNNQPLTQIAHALNISEEAAKKRVSRALEKLRKLFTKKHLPLAAPLHAALLAKNALAAPPPHAATCSPAPRTPTTATTTATLLAKSTTKLLFWSTTKLTTATTAALLLTTAGTAALLQHLHVAPPIPTTPIAAPAPLAPKITSSPSTLRRAKDPIPTIEVRDLATNTPLPNVHIQLFDHTNDALATSGATSPQGKLTLHYPPGITSVVQLTAESPGYVPIRHTWIRTLPSDPAPDHFLLHLEKAITVGGRVLDTDNNPLPNATVLVVAQKSYDPDTVVADLPLATTDANGRWSLTAAPDNCPIAVGASHPQCLTGLGNIYPEPIDRHPNMDPTLLPQLRNHTHILRLRRGIPVTGTVLGPDGKPRKALLTIGNPGDNPVPPISTANDGHFEFAVHGKCTITAHADGLGWTFTQLNVTDTPLNTTINLPAPKPLAIHVVDPQNSPIPNALFYFVTISSDDRKSQIHIPLKLLSNKNGDILWPDAPPVAIVFILTAPGFLAHVDNVLDPHSPGPHPFTLIPQPIIHLRAVSADSGQPLTDYWLRSESIDFRRNPDNSYDFAPPCQDPRYFTILAAGHTEAPVPVPSFPIDGQDYTITLPLSHTDRFDGQLLNADDSPLRHTPACIIAESDFLKDGLYPFNPETLTDNPHNRTTTDNDGNFSLPPQSAPCFILAATDAGYVLMHSRVFEPAGAASLLHWSTLEGTLQINNHPAPAGTPVTAYLGALQNRNPATSRGTVTDARGHFTLAHLTAGDWQIMPATYADTNPPVTHVKLRPGQTATLALSLPAPP